jgi:hypothetical protein
VRALALLALAAAAFGCSRRLEEPFLTYFNPEHGLTLHYPSSWKTEQAQQDGVSYRYFLAPPTGPERKPAVSVTLVAGPLGVPLDQYAQTYLAGNTVQSSREETRTGARGKYHLFASPDGKTRFALLLLEESTDARMGLPATPTPRPSASAASPAAGGKTSITVRPSPTPIATPVPPPAAAAPPAYVYGLFAQGDTAAFEPQLPVIEEMAKSLTLERPALYPEEANDKFGFALRVPPSWPSTRSFASGNTFLQQYTSPAFGADKRQTVHASLTLTAEPAAGDVEAYYKAAQDKAGDTVSVLSHTPWRGGYVDVIQSETPVAVTRARRYFRVADGRGYSLACDARDDIYSRVWRWCDMIAATLKIGPEVKAP